MKNIRRALLTSALAIAACGMASAGTITQTFSVPTGGGSQATNFGINFNAQSYAYLQSLSPALLGTLNSVSINYSWAATGNGSGTDGNTGSTGTDNYTFQSDIITSITTAAGGTLGLRENTGNGLGVGDTVLGNSGTGCVATGTPGLTNKSFGASISAPACLDSDAIEAGSGNEDAATLSNSWVSGTQFNFFLGTAVINNVALKGNASSTGVFAGSPSTGTFSALVSEAVTITYNYSAPVTGTPEPATMFLMGSALIGVGLLRKRIKA